MKISTKIISGYGVLIALMVGLLAHQVYTVRRMQQIIENLSKVNFEAADIALRMRMDILLVEEFTKKYFVSPDSAYGKSLRKSCQGYESELSNIQSVVSKIQSAGRGRQEAKEIQVLAGFWASFTEELARQQSEPGGKLQGIPSVLVEQLEKLEEQTRNVQ